MEIVLTLCDNKSFDISDVYIFYLISKLDKTIISILID